MSRGKKASEPTETAAPAAELLTADGIPVRCACTRLEAIGLVKPNPENPKVHKRKQLALYWRIIREAGWRRSIVVSARSGLIVKGHGAYMAAMENGATEVPIDVQPYATQKEEEQDMLADNRLAELAENDEDKLRVILSRLGEEDGLDLTGFTADDLAKLVASVDGKDDAEFPITARLHEEYDYVVVYTTNKSDFAFLQELLGLRTERSYKKTGVGLGRVIGFERFTDAISKNRHSLDVQVGHDDYAPADPGVVGVRAGEPG